MAKKTESVVTPVVAAIIAFFGRVWWNPAWNSARPTQELGDEKARKTIRDSFITDCWYKTGDGTVEVEAIGSCVMGTKEELLTLAMADLNARLANFEQQAKLDSSKLIELTVFKEMYCDDKGEIIPPDYIGCSGNRRQNEFFLAMVERRRQNLGTNDYTIPMSVCHFQNKQARRLAILLENNNKAKGFLPPSELDNFLVSREMFLEGQTQADLRKAFTDTTGQKLYWIHELNRRFPEAKFSARLQAKPDDADYIRLAAVKGPELPNLGMRSDPEELAKKNAELARKGHELIKPLDLSGFVTYINQIGKVPGGNEPKIMAKDGIKSMSVQQADPAIRDAAKAIIDNSTEGLAKYVTRANGSAAYHSLCDQGDYPTLEYILLTLISLSAQARENCFKDLVACVDKHSGK